MIHDYSDTIARHYAAYRPALHEVILSTFLQSNTTFNKALDIGCGNGYSSVALARWCEEVYGLEVQEAMLATAVIHPKVHYYYHQGFPYPFEAMQFDIITFAGSLYYAKAPQLIPELTRIAKKHSRVLVYDFDIQMQSIIDQLPIRIPNPQSNYNHQIDFSDSGNAFQLISTLSSTYSLKLQLSELSHLLLAEHRLNRILYQNPNIENPHTYLIELLQDVFDSNDLEISAQLYGKEYQI